MKNIRKYIFPSLFIWMLLGTACEDEILVPVEDTTKADQLLAEIDSAKAAIRDAENLVVDYNEEKNAVMITCAGLEAKLDSLYNVRDSLWNVGSWNDNPSITYTVNVVSAAHSVSKNTRFSGYIDAEVTITQNGLARTATATSGQAVFPDVENDAIEVVVKADGWTKVRYTAYIYNPNGSSNYNASTSVSLYPLTKENGALEISGTAYANISTLNDTLDRVYPSAAGSSLEGTFISEPNNNPTTTNYTQWSDYEYNQSIYGSVNDREVNFEFLQEGTKIYAIPSINNWFGVSDNGSGYVTSITYFGLIGIAEVQADGSYQFLIPRGYDDDYGLDIYVDPDALDLLEHERLIDEPADTVRGQLVDFTYYNASGGSVNVFDGGTSGMPYSGVWAGSDVVVNSGETAVIKRRKVAEIWKYRAIYTDPADGYEWDDLSLSYDAAPSETSFNANIYAYPYYFVSE
jgi:hypothetical protein